MAGLRQAQTARRQSERLQNRTGLITSILLVPTLVVSIYGANMSLRGRDAWTGFWIMLALVVASIAVSFVAFTALDRRERRRAEPTAGTDKETEQR